MIIFKHSCIQNIHKMKIKFQHEETAVERM